MVAELRHEFCGRIAQGKGDGQVARGAHELEGFVDALVGRVALGRRGEVDGGFGEGNAPFGPSDFCHRIEGRVGQEQGVGVGQANVFRGRNHEAARNELRVLAALDHACQPVESRVGVAAADALDEGRNDVVVHFALFVVGEGILLELERNGFVVDDHRC